MKIDRRAVIVGAGAAAVAAGVGGFALRGDTPMPGTLAGADFGRGHRLRDGGFPLPADHREIGTVIVGGGIAGLSAAWALAEAGRADFRLLELEDGVGGNARSGRNAISAYPLGAHYLPIPNAEAHGVRHLLERLGIITGWQDGKPLFDPYQVVSDPDERLLHLGRWQEGLVPTIGLTAQDRHEIDAFFAAMRAFRDRKDAAGRPAFAIPMALSAEDADLRALDRLSFAAWLDGQGWHSTLLRAHLRYACRDDYGTELDELSAWAGIHYFAGRRGVAANCDGDAVLTWPEGNGHLAAALGRRVAAQTHGGQIVFRVMPGNDSGSDGVTIDSFDVATERTIRWRARSAILATPHFISARLLGEEMADGFSYAPWVVANVSVDRLPEGPGAQLAWDNVSWTSASLGYVVATHQDVAAVQGRSVLTWYMALSDMPPAEARQLMIDRPLAEWQAIVAADLIATNPDLAGAIRRIDVWRWGHAMIRPTPNFIWGGARDAAGHARPPLYFAHSDLSGLSIFEEAHYRGTIAAETMMRDRGLRFASILEG